MVDAKLNKDPFPAWRAASIAAGLVGFLVIFRPFGLSIDNPAELLIVLGFAPLNFLGMMLVHAPSISGGVVGAAIRIGAIIAANLAYIVLLTNERANAALSVKVILVAMLTVGAIIFWNQRRSLQQEVLELRAQKTADEPAIVVLRGESENEIVRVRREALRFAAANGNYVDVHYLKNGAVEKVMLRGTLASILEQAPNDSFIRCHRSYLVNLGAAQRIVSKGGSTEVEFADGARIPVSRAYRQAIRAAALQ